MNKGKKPTFRARVNLHPPTFRSVVYNCSVHSKANRFVFKQSYDFSVILLVTVVKKRSGKILFRRGTNVLLVVNTSSFRSFDNSCIYFQSCCAVFNGLDYLN